MVWGRIHCVVELRLPVFAHSRSWTLVFSVYDHDKISHNVTSAATIVPGSPGAIDFLNGEEQDVWLDLIAVRFFFLLFM